MKKNLHFLRLNLMLFVLFQAFSAQATVVPYLPALQNINGSAVDLTTFYPNAGNYTLEMQGVAGTQISVAGGVYTYTPVSSGTIRFSQKNGKIYVYEGNKYMTTLTAVATTQYPTIANETAHTDVNNLLQDGGFETHGSLVGGTNYNFGTNWVTNVVVAASAGIRVTDATTGNINGTWECIWRGSGNDKYFAQELAATIKPNTTYKVIVNQLTGGNAFANFNVGLGSTVNGLEYGSMPIVLGNGKNGTWSVSFRTPASITTPVYFTFKNTLTNTSSSGNDPLTQIDYIALVEGVDVTGITGATSATILVGTAYAPENLAVDFAKGDYIDMTPVIINPSFEINGAEGWTNVGGFWSQTNSSFPYKAGNVYFEKWQGSGNWSGLKLSQIIADLPNGVYKLTAGALNSPNTTGGAFIFANNEQAEVKETNDYTVLVTVTDNQLEIGYRVDNGGNYVATDNFRLSYISDGSPYFILADVPLVFDASHLTRTFTVTGGNLTGNVELSAPAGILLDKEFLTPAEVAAGATITATFDNSTVIADGSITASATGMDAQTVKINTVNATANTACVTPPISGLVNLVVDPGFNSLTSYAGWGAENKFLVNGAESYCGNQSLKVIGACGASVDYVLTGLLSPNTTYRLKAMVKSNNEFYFTFNGCGIDGVTTDYQKMFATGDVWEQQDFTFTTGTLAANQYLWMNSCTGSNRSTITYLDNLELYDITGTTGTKAVNSTMSSAYVRDNKVVVKLNLELAGEVEISLYNVNGMLINSQKSVCVNGTSEKTLNADLQNGIYFVKVTNAGKSMIQKIVK